MRPRQDRNVGCDDFHSPADRGGGKVRGVFFLNFGGVFFFFLIFNSLLAFPEPCPWLPAVRAATARGTSSYSRPAPPPAREDAAKEIKNPPMWGDRPSGLPERPGPPLSSLPSLLRLRPPPPLDHVGVCDLLGARAAADARHGSVMPVNGSRAKKPTKSPRAHRTARAQGSLLTVPAGGTRTVRTVHRTYRASTCPL